MIKLITRTSSGAITNYVAPDAIARITEAGTSSQWHGIRSYVRTFDGETLECEQSVDEIHAALEQHGGAA